MTDGVHRKMNEVCERAGISAFTQVFAIWRTFLISPQITRERLDLVFRCVFISINHFDQKSELTKTIC